jgi:hypothetical protein
MVQIEKINRFLNIYEDYIIVSINYFIENFQVKNPNSKWRNGLVKRTGFLDKDSKIEYSFHGVGCTIEFNNGEIVSFDFSENDDYSFDFFKFKVFLETNSQLDISNLNLEDIFKEFEVKKINGRFVMVIKNKWE